MKNNKTIKIQTFRKYALERGISIKIYIDFNNIIKFTNEIDVINSKVENLNQISIYYEVPREWLTIGISRIYHKDLYFSEMCFTIILKRKYVENFKKLESKKWRGKIEQNRKKK